MTTTIYLEGGELAAGVRVAPVTCSVTVYRRCQPPPGRRQRHEADSCCPCLAAAQAAARRRRAARRATAGARTGAC